MAAGWPSSGVRAPARQWWFVGAGSSAERESTLLLANVDPGPAVVDVVVSGTAGRLDTTGTDGVRIPAGGQAALPLSGLAAGAGEVAIDVEATEGRVVAAVADDWSGFEAAGSDWVPASPPPARSLLVPGVLDPEPGSRLVVANPGEAATPVDVSLLDDTGTFVPTGSPRLVVPAGGVVSVRLPDVGTGAALLVEAAVPVTATARVRTDADVAYASAAVALDGAAVVPVALGDTLRKAGLRLQLASPLASLPAEPSGTAGPGATAPARSVTVSAYDAGGARLASNKVEVAAGAATTVDPVADLRLDAGDRGATGYLVVTPDDPPAGAGPLTAVAVLLDPDGQQALLGLSTGLQQVVVPVLTPSVVPRG